MLNTLIGNKTTKQAIVYAIDIGIRGVESNCKINTTAKKDDRKAADNTASLTGKGQDKTNIILNAHS